MRAGHNLQLTLDSAIQDRVEQVLAQVGLNFSPKLKYADVEFATREATLVKGNALQFSDGSVDFSYTYNNDHHVTGHLQVAGGGATGTVSVTTPTCHIDYPFSAVWYE